MKTRIWNTAWILLVSFALPDGIAEAAWTKFTSPNGYFTASFPTTPVETQKSDKTFIGTIWENIARSKSAAGSFAVEYSKLPGIAVDLGGHNEIFKKAKDGFLKQTGASETSYSDISLGSAPGKEMIYQTASGQSGKIRMYIDGHRFYFLDAQSPQGNSATDPFFSSFQILPAPDK